MVCGAARTPVDSDLAPTEVLNLIPVRPLGEMEAHMTGPYRSRLPAIHQKIRLAAEAPATAR
jgi:pyrroline-5-carboxylate reductase